MQDLFEKLYSRGKTCFYDDVRKMLCSGELKIVITANPETFMLAERNPRFREVLQSDTCVVVPDGIGIVMAAKRLGMDIHERITGVELAEHLLACADELRKKVFLYGAKTEVLAALKERLSREMPGVEIIGAFNGYDHSDEKIVERVRRLHPDLVMAALGIPRQELFLSACAKVLDKGVLMGVGGSFDIMSGLKRRAPAILIKMNLEWLYRIVREPRRMNRFIENNVKFFMIYRKRLKGSGNGQN